MTSRDELRTALDLLFQEHEDELKSDDPPMSFDGGRDLGPDMYAQVVLLEAKRRGSLMAACADLADAIGRVDDDEAEIAVRAIQQHWTATANALDPCDPMAIRLRMVAFDLERALSSPNLDFEMIPDLVDVEMLQNNMLDASIEWHDAVAKGPAEEAEARFWEENEERVRLNFESLAALRRNLADRGEVGLDGELIDPDE